MDEEEIKNKARHYLLYEHNSPLSEIMHQTDLKAEMQYHKDIENAYIAGAMAMEEMKKDAVEVEVSDDWQYGKDADHKTQPAIKLRCPELKIGQKVKVIIIKE